MTRFTEPFVTDRFDEPSFFYLYNNRANPLLYVSRALGSDCPHFVPEARKTSP